MKGRGVRCWPYGHGTRDDDCDAEIPDGDYETMRRFGWGWVWARDDGAASGEGPFMACPEHRSDLNDEEQRQIARERFASACARHTGEGGEP